MALLGIPHRDDAVGGQPDWAPLRSVSGTSRTPASVSRRAIDLLGSTVRCCTQAAVSSTVRPSTRAIRTTWFGASQTGARPSVGMIWMKPVTGWARAPGGQPSAARAPAAAA